MPRTKRTIEELANKSDSDDDDYSDHPIRSARQAISRSRTKTKTKKKGRPARKKRRGSSTDDFLSDDEDFLSEVQEDSDVAEEEDVYAEKNARGTVRRTAAKNRPVYNEDEDENSSEGGEEDMRQVQEEDDDEGEEEEEEKVEDSEPTSPPKKIVKLKVPNLKRQISTDVPNDNFPVTRRSSRHTRNTSDDVFALSNSGRHVETVRQGSREPIPSKRPRVAASAGVPEASQEGDEEMPDAATGSQVEVQESAQPSFEGEQSGADEQPPGGSKAEATDQEQHDFVPESENDGGDEAAPTTRRRSRRNRRRQTTPTPAEQEEKSSPSNLRRSGRKKPPKSSRRRKGGDDEESDFEPEEDANDEDDDDEESQSEKSDGSPQKGSQTQNNDEEDDNDIPTRRPGLRKRKPRSLAQTEGVAGELAEELEDLRADRPRRKAQHQIIYEKPRRSRKDVDYRIIRPDLLFPLEEAENEVTESPSRRGRGGGAGGGAWQRSLFPTYGPFGGGGPSAVLAPPGGPAATGGVDSDSSDDDTVQQAKDAGVSPSYGGAPPAQAFATETNQGLSGTPANLGKVKDKQTLADADPLGVDPAVNFDGVGGLQGHIDQLKEMVSLPLLYPEIFQRFHIVPPRGVLFHGPPGTGKTLLARALANSVSSEGRKVTFYMRKGADALSKWVGEAERQLRLLFDEARKTQPSIVFFDEIDGECCWLFFFFFFFVDRSLTLEVTRTGTGTIEQAGTDPFLYCFNFAGINGWHGRSWPSRCHWCY